MAFAFDRLRSSCVRPDVHSALRQDSHNDLTPCRMAWHFVFARTTAPDSDEMLGPTATRGRRTPLVAIAPSLPMLLRKSLKHSGPPLPDGRMTPTRPGHYRFFFHPTHTIRKRAGKFPSLEFFLYAKLKCDFDLALFCLF